MIEMECRLSEGPIRCGFRNIVCHQCSKPHTTYTPGVLIRSTTNGASEKGPELLTPKELDYFECDGRNSSKHGACGSVIHKSGNSMIVIATADMLATTIPVALDLDLTRIPLLSDVANS